MQQKNKKLSAFGRVFSLVLRTVIVLLVLLLLGAVYGGYLVTNSEKNLPNMSLDGIPVGGLTQEETAQKLREQGWDRINSMPLEVDLPMEISLMLNRSEAGGMISAEEAAEQIFSWGHDAHWFSNLEKGLDAWFSRDVAVKLRRPAWNEEYLRRNTQSACERYQEKIGNGDVLLDKKNARLSIVKGGGQLWIDEEKLYQAIITALENGQEKLQYTSLEGTVQVPNFESVYRDVTVDPQDARFDENWEIVPEIIGCSFGVEEAVSLWEAADFGETVEIPLTITEPAVHAEDLEGILYRDRLCFMTTNFWGSSANRINNIHLAAEKLNGVTVMPGQVFSYNDTIGQRTEEAGFRLAGAYADGEVTEEIGGGICQVSSTLYCAAMYAQMTTVSRTNHYFQVSYLSMGYDATVSWTWPDYKFRNDRDYPVVLVAWADDHSVTVEFWGTNTDGTHVSPYTSTWEVYDETYKHVLIGYGAITHRRILDAFDNVIATIDEPTGIYYLHDEEIDWPPEKLAADAAAAYTILVP